MTWQPIETAPRDGTPVWIWIPSTKFLGEAYIEEGWSCWKSGYDDIPLTGEATRWQPLPEPPKEDSL